MRIKFANLVKYKTKLGGKNNSLVDGFYRNAQGEEFFIKSPADKKELFTELFAGLLLDELKTAGVIPKPYHSLMIGADYIQLPDNSYALIQTKINFIELYKIIGTSNKKKSDRNVVKEILNGKAYYQTLTQNDRGLGLPWSLLYSLLLGAYSVHSGNIVELKENKMLARIDWGDAFRHYGIKKNDNILFPHEYKGLLNIKQVTKSYIQYYKNIPGLFDEISEKADELQSHLSEALLLKLVTNALSKIPSDLVDASTKSELAKYMALPDFKSIDFSDPEKINKVANQFTHIMLGRLNKLSQLTTPDSSKKVTENKSQRFHSKAAYKNKLMVDLDNDLSQQFNHWENLIENSNFNQLRLPDLEHQFNQYVNTIADKVDAIVHTNPLLQTNLLASFQSETNENNNKGSTAFIPCYRESTLIRRLFIQTMQANVSKDYSELNRLYNKAYPDSIWNKITGLLENCVTIIDAFKAAQTETERSYEKISVLKGLLKQHKIYEAELNHIFTQFDASNSSTIYPFYPIDTQILATLTGEQLLVVCFEELAVQTTPIIEQIIIDDSLWILLSATLNKKNTFSSSEVAYINNLNQLRMIQEKFKEFALTDALQNKQIILSELNEKYNLLPRALKNQRLTHQLESAKRDFNQLQVVQTAYGKTLNQQLISQIFGDTAESEEILYLRRLNSWNELDEVGLRLDAFKELEKTYKAISDPSFNIKRNFKLQLKKVQFYRELLLPLNSFYTGQTAKKIDLILEFINLTVNFNHITLDNLLNDKIFWSLFLMTPLQQFDSARIHDCLKIKNFHDTKFLINPITEIDKDYNKSLHNFYRNSLTIRLSDIPLPEQVELMRDNAHHEFKHRHNTRRLIADVMLLLASFIGVGVIIGLARIAYRKTYFFSNAATKREQILNKEVDSSPHRPTIF